jgi:hypothetical protein
MWLLLSLITVCLTCSAQDAATLLKRSNEASRANGEKAAQYTYIEETSHYQIDDKSGARKLDSIDTFEVMTLEGDSYKKLIAHGAKPLSAKESSHEEKKFKQTAAQRRKSHNGLLHHSYTFGWSEEEELALRDCTLSEQLEIRGHRTQSVECVPKSNYTPKNKHERDVMNFKTKTFIDLEEIQPVRLVMTVVGNETPVKPGTVFTLDFEKINGDAWLPYSSESDFRVQFAKLIKDAGHDESRDSNYRKFEAKSSILDTH